MKKIVLFLVFITLVNVNCKNNKTASQVKAEASISSDKIPFEGIWKRSFELAKDSVQQVFYRVWTDSIQYEMQGPLPIKYTIYKDTFISKENKWIGKLNKVPYVVFVKNITTDSVTLFKKQVENKAEAIQMNFPSENDSSHFSSWNTYYLKK